MTHLTWMCNINVQINVCLLQVSCSSSNEWKKNNWQLKPKDMLGNWNIKANDPTDSLSVFISVQHPELGDYFVASLKAKRLSSVSDHAMFFWLMPHKVALWIYWHALKLWWKNVHFIQHPRYTNPTYREEAMIRDKKLQCNQALAWDRGNCLQADGHHPGNLADRKRWFKWRDAKRPWC
ncbi:hypothetical protein NC652_027840 [Populus alba x Populus x berolinensis]|nr:hypothetical protein NC652_027840 [Populus alba x Populus x berolinensis]